MLAKKFYLDNSRLTTDLGMILLTIAGCYLTSIYAAGSTFNEIVAIGTGYVSLLMLAITLLIGPLNLLRKRKNPVNINLRRDIGIWSGITACLHVIFSLQIYPGKGILEYFTGQPQKGAVPSYGLFEVSNGIGLIAMLIMVGLMVTSNQVSLIWLKGKRWKLLQRFNYGLIVLALVHTFAFQVINLRESYFFYATIILSLAVLVAQGAGIAITMSRANARKAANATPSATAPAMVAQSGQITMARRRFLAVTGATLLGGVAVSGTAGYLLGRHRRDEDDDNVQRLAQVPANTTAPNAPANSGAANSNTGANSGNTGAPPSNGFGGRQRGGGFGGQGGNPNTGTGSTSGGATVTTPAAGSSTQPGGSAATTTTPAAGSSSQSGSTSTSRSLILGNFASLPAGSALKFTTPDTGETAFVIHEKDGTVKAYSGICTHRPYTLVFNQAQQALVCDLHNVPFNIITGAPTRSPARTALASYTVHVDAQNNIVYG